MMVVATPDTHADKRIKVCLRRGRSFAVIAGAGSGKTTSLVKALEEVRAARGREMRATGKRIACITYTNRAVAVIKGRLGADDLFLVSTIHGFLWQEIRRFQREIRDTVVSRLIPLRISKRRGDDNGGDSRVARSARRRILELENARLTLVAKEIEFSYEESGGGSRYAQGRLDHDDIIDLFSLMVAAYPVLRKIIGQKYPFIMIDEAQDTFSNVIEALNSITSDAKHSLVGYFGDPMQQIFEGRAGNFAGPAGSAVITKPENYRCSLDVIDLLNAFRSDIQQKPGPNNVKGSIEIRLIRAERGKESATPIRSNSFSVLA
jgi:DNA helicase II / ATP-dependent DNA helicase PcrA